MMKLAIGLALLILAALLAAVGWVLLRPRWRWERPVVDKVEAAAWTHPRFGLIEPHWSPELPTATYSTGSPESVTSRADNGTGLFV